MRNVIYKILTILQIAIFYPQLKNFGFINIRLFKFSSWHHGVGYLTADNKQGDRVFLKTSGTYNAAECEYYCLTELYKLIPSLIPEPIEIFRKYSMSIVAMEAIEGEELTSTIVSREQYRVFCEEVIDALNMAEICHRDIHEGNLLFSKNKGLVLIDFAWAIHKYNIERDKQHVASLRTLGNEYKLSKYTWQDSFSLEKVGSKLFDNSFKVLKYTKPYEYKI
ncbi:RIO1 family regulatory kinase/ATPase [uncultured Vibrio sp.]|uniref:RIO1 family regulatory kinase/ATPase domain-containing protein n=1 Tax=uncultured Vibrio sp. TaxID=114054 RepID=UPI0026320687|nr:RIO1 family regulatory kinase/ATPase [uncultured Vibrio sp.]